MLEWDGSCRTCSGTWSRSCWYSREERTAQECPPALPCRRSTAAVGHMPRRNAPVVGFCEPLPLHECLRELRGRSWKHLRCSPNPPFLRRISWSLCVEPVGQYDVRSDGCRCEPCETLCRAASALGDARIGYCGAVIRVGVGDGGFSLDGSAHLESVMSVCHRWRRRPYRCRHPRRGGW